VEHKLRRSGVVADDDEAGWHTDAGIGPGPVCLRIMSVECTKSRYELGRKALRIELSSCLHIFLGEFLSDVFPKVPEHRHLTTRQIIGDRYARKFYDPAFNRVHE